jgi:hypothetical protein
MFPSQVEVPVLWRTAVVPRHVDVVTAGQQGTKPTTLGIVIRASPAGREM